MADPAIDQRRALEALIAQRVEAEAVQRGWDLGPQAWGAQLSTSGAELDADVAVTFSTGYDGTVTTTPFTFDISTLGGGDILL